MSAHWTAAAEREARRRRDLATAGLAAATAIAAGLGALAYAAAHHLSDRWATWALLALGVAYVVTQTVVIPLMTPARAGGVQ